MDKLHQALRRYFGYHAFKKGQETIIKSVLEGRDTVAMLPTDRRQFQLSNFCDPVYCIPFFYKKERFSRRLCQTIIQRNVMNERLKKRTFTILGGLNKMVQNIPKQCIYICTVLGCSAPFYSIRPKW